MNPRLSISTRRRSACRRGAPENPWSVASPLAPGSTARIVAELPGTTYGEYPLQSGDHPQPDLAGGFGTECMVDGGAFPGSRAALDIVRILAGLARKRCRMRPRQANTGSQADGSLLSTHQNAVALDGEVKETKVRGGSGEISPNSPVRCVDSGSGPFASP